MKTMELTNDNDTIEETNLTKALPKTLTYQHEMDDDDEEVQIGEGIYEVVDFEESNPNLVAEGLRMTFVTTDRANTQVNHYQRKVGPAYHTIVEGSTSAALHI